MTYHELKKCPECEINMSIVFMPNEIVYWCMICKKICADREGEY